MEKSIKLLISSFLEKGKITCKDINRFLYILLYEDIQNKNIILSYFLGMLFNMDYKRLSCFLRYILKLSNPSLLNKKYILYKDESIKTILLMGSGKKIKNTLNISTLSYLTANSLGVPIIKLGSYGVASKLGSRDILEKNGFSTDYFLDINHREKFFQFTGFMFLPIEGLIPRFDNIYGGKFNFITPISYGLGLVVSPYETDIIMYGISFRRIKKAELIIRDIFKNIKKIYIYGSTLNKFNFDEIISSDIYGNFSPEIKKFVKLKLSNFSQNEIAKSIYVNSKNKKYLFKQIINGRGNNIQNTIISLNSAILLKLSGVYQNLDIAFNASIQALKGKKVVNHFNNLKKINEELWNSGK